MYPNVSLFIDGAWMQAAARGSLPVVSPASGDTIGSVRMPTALISTVHWRPLLTMEQGKPLPEARGELLAAADVIDCFAEEARRTYGRVIPARTEGVYQLVVKEPVGPVAGSRRGTSRSTRWCASCPARSLLDHREGAGGDAGLARRTDPLLRRRGRAGRRDEPGVRRGLGDFRVPHPAPGHPQDVVHRVHRGGQAACGDRRRPHEARDDGAWRPCPGNCVRRCRCGHRKPVAGNREVPQCRTGTAKR